jgi:hypothetical protein
MMFEEEGKRFASTLELFYKKGMMDGYRKAEKEIGVVWHDLRKNPNDLPPRKGLETYSSRVITDKGYGMYNFRKCRWYVDDPDCGFMAHTEVVAWCDIPRFKEGV